MTMKMYNSLKDKQIFSSDAYEIGSVIDVNYVPDSWIVRSLAVRGAKDLGDVLGSSVFKKHKFSLNIGSYEINDVIIIPEIRDHLQKALVDDNKDIEGVDNLIGKKVISSDLVPLGTIADIGIDLDVWRINSFKVRIDKSVANALDIKLGLLNKTASGLLTSHVASVTDTVNLSRKVEDMRGNFNLD